MKKRSNILLVLLLVVSVFVVGCAKTDDSKSEKTGTDKIEETDKESSSDDKSEISDDSDKSVKKRVAIVLPVDHLAMNATRDGMIDAISKEFGEDNVEFIVKNANGEDTLLNSILSEVVGSDPDIILPIATGPSQVAATTTSEIPIVFSAVTDPVAAGLTPSWEAAGPNVTGVSDMVDIEAIIDFALELYPEAKTFGIVYNSAEVNSQVQAEICKEILESKGLSYKEGTITNTSELQQVVENLAVDVDAFYSPADNDVASAIPIFQQVANQHNLPIFPDASTMVEAGGTGTVGLDYYDLGLQAGEVAVRILKGESVADNPPELVEKVTKILNKDQVEVLGITVPAALEAEIEFVTTQEQ